jgi:hypothetical protein
MCNAVAFTPDGSQLIACTSRNGQLLILRFVRGRIVEQDRHSQSKQTPLPLRRRAISHLCGLHATRQRLGESDKLQVRYQQQNGELEQRQR